MNLDKTVKKEKSKTFVYISFVISIIVFLILLFITILTPELYKISNTITNNALKSSMAYNMYSKSHREKSISKNKINIAKNIDQYNSLDDGVKALTLLLLSGQVHVNLLGLQKTNDNVAFFNNFQNQDDFFKIYKKDLDSTSDSDIQIYKKYLQQLVEHYKSLPKYPMLSDGYIGQILEKNVNLSDDYVKAKVLGSLYSLNNSIEHWKEIKELTYLKFNRIDFEKNKNTYWNENFSATHGKEIPEYVNIFYDKSSIDLNTAQTWINNFKLEK